MITETGAMLANGFKFYICVEYHKQYPAQKENPQSKCLFCLQQVKDENSSL